MSLCDMVARKSTLQSTKHRSRYAGADPVKPFTQTPALSLGSRVKRWISRTVPFEPANIEDGDGRTAAGDPQWRFTVEDWITIIGSDETVEEFRKRVDVTSTESIR